MPSSGAQLANIVNEAALRAVRDSRHHVTQEDLEEIILWCIEVGLPVTLAELGAGKVTDEQLMEVATTACAENDTLHNMPFEVTPETVFAAIKAADAYGRYYLDEE